MRVAAELGHRLNAARKIATVLRSENQKLREGTPEEIERARRADEQATRLIVDPKHVSDVNSI